MATDLQIAVRKVVSINPATGETLRSFDSVGDEDVRGAVSRARAAQQGWNALGLRKRLAIVRNFQQLLHEKKSEVAQVVTREAGKPYVEALLTEVAVVLDTAGFLLDNAYRLLRPEPVSPGRWTPSCLRCSWQAAAMIRWWCSLMSMSTLSTAARCSAHS